MLRLTRRLLMAAFVVTATAGISTADIILYTSEVDFQATASGLTTIDFANHTAGGSLTSYSTASGLTVGPINFVGNTTNGLNFLYVIRPDFFPSYDGRPAGSSPTVLGGPSGGGPATAVGTLDVTLTGNYSAIASELYVVQEGNAGSPAGQISVSVTDLSGTYIFVIDTPAGPNIGFAGFISDSRIESISYAGVGTAIYPELANFQYGFGPTAAVPEPASMAMLGTGALGLLGYARRRKTIASA